MNNSSLLHTKKKLTIIFTLLVLSLAILLEIVFFTWKYFNSFNNEKNNFSIITNNISSKFITLNDFVTNYSLTQKWLRMWQWIHSSIMNNNQEEFVNILIINRDKKELAFSNIINDIDIDLITNYLSKNNYSQINQVDWYLIKKTNFTENNTNYDVLFIKFLKYGLVDYLTDLLWFVFITFIFSILFYYIWYKFVSKNLEPVEENLSDMHDFIHNAWHELKTPISIIHSNLQLIKQTKTFEEDLILEWITEINKLDMLIESLIELSNINSSEHKQNINLNDEIKGIIKDFKSKSEKKEISIIYTKKSDKILNINRQYFYILFSNILSNAIRYNKKWWKINVTLYKNKIIIKDTWIWMKKEDLEKIFDRFFMLDNSRNNEWHWIWLSLVKKIADIYKMKISVKSEEKKWSEFIIEF